MPVLLYRYMYRIGARATFRHHARAEEALQHSSLIATEELTELLKPVVPCPSNIFRCDTRPAKPLDLCLVDLYQNPDLSMHVWAAPYKMYEAPYILPYMTGNFRPTAQTQKPTVCLNFRPQYRAPHPFLVH